MADKQNTPITSATVTIHKKSDDSLVATASYANLLYTASNVDAGEYYYKITASGRGTVIEDLDLIAGDTESPVNKTILMKTGIDSIPVTLVDKDDAYITDATVKIARIPGVYDASTKYDVPDVPIGTNKLAITHTDTSYQSIEEDVLIESDTEINKTLYPALDIYVKVFVTFPGDSESTDVSSNSGCKLYNVTTIPTAGLDNKVTFSNPYFKLTNMNDGSYNLLVTSFQYIHNGTNYTIPETRETVYFSYTASTDGDIYLNIDINLNS